MKKRRRKNGATIIFDNHLKKKRKMKRVVIAMMTALINIAKKCFTTEVSTESVARALTQKKKISHCKCSSSLARSLTR
jgi:hypothetical protein